VNGDEVDQLLAPRIIAERPPRILTVDIETSPNLAHVWGLWGQNVGLSQLLESGHVICFAAKWYGANRVLFHSDHHDGHAAMVEAAHELMSQADIIVHYNGKRFDVPHLYTEMADVGMTPPSPHKDVDLLQVVKQRFRYPSNKLDYVAGRLLGEHKVQHTGHRLWLGCVVQDDPKAWRMMRRYNIGDVRLTERLYDRLRPWIKGHPHIGLWSGEERSCANCGGLEFRAEGWAETDLTAYAQYQCEHCGAWMRNKNRKTAVQMRGVR
jgi:hypothetical protein